MNEHLLKCPQNVKTVFAACLGLWAINASGQGGIAVFGNTHIAAGGQLHTSAYTLYLEGGLSTERNSPKGVVSFDTAAQYSNAGTGKFTDGYVRAYKTGSFTFPVGSGNIYAPITVNLDNTNAVDAAYNHEGFNATAFDPLAIETLYATGYWDVLGNNSGTVTLAWEESSGLGTLADAVDQITIAGWNGTNWVVIASAATEAGTLASGTISTAAAVDFNTYSAFTFAKLYEEEITGLPDTFKPQTYLILKDNVFTLQSGQNVAQVTLYDLTGRQLGTYDVNAETYTAAFNHPKTVYLAKVTLTDGHVLSRKLMHQ